MIITECVNGMIEVDEYSYDGIVTPAYIISAESEDPLLASNLVNEMLSYYFMVEKENTEKDFSKAIRVSC